MISAYAWLARRVRTVLTAKGALRRYLLCAVVFAAAGMPVVSPARALAPIETVSVHELPREAQVTLDLVRRGGPFPYRRDGIEFQNRERRLPPRPRGYYHEYTVVTPGARDRGASRIIAGDREYYFSADHYRSFRRIVP
jgi:ribonuclease T1